ncbi:MAG: hypothetical protein JO235_05535 [Chroococcidiopsidaceae cyanobacterium CP_BM_RX_35]|nr:hypothetical protein [Chroococcidiopsidaceae cyanobacterium CP_BM_RX_35]
MKQATYLRQLDAVLQGEVFGESAYATAARYSRDGKDILQWQALSQLEVQTKERVAEAIRRNGGVPRQRSFFRILGVSIGWLASLLPWRLTMNGLWLITRCTIPFFERLEYKGAAGDIDFLRALTAHEQAQQEFAVRKLAGQHTTSLEPILFLLDVTG